MKKIFITLISLFLIYSNSSPMFAQELATTSTSANKIEVESFLESQSVWNKRIPIIVKFRTNFDSNNVEITWDTPSGISVTSNQEKFLTVVANQTYTYTGYITPINPGSYSISSNVIAWQYNTNYTSSSPLTLKISDNLLVDPLPADYTGMVVLKYAIFTIGGGLILFGLFFIVKKFSKVFIKWLRPPL